MKTRLMLFATILATGAARGDLVMQQLDILSGVTNIGTIRIHANMFRQDIHILSENTNHEDTTVIMDLNTSESIVLNRRLKMATKITLSDPDDQRSQQRRQLFEKQGDPVDTGKSESVGGYNAEIYSWSMPPRIIETIWVATNFPDFKDIQADIAKFDQVRDPPHLSHLPGMVIRTETKISVGLETRGSGITNMLISAKKELVEPLIFEVPPDYKKTWTSQTNTSSATDK